MEFSHIPVLLDQCIEGLNIDPAGTYIDGTCGGAGHSRVIASKLSSGGRLIGIDRDPDAVATASQRLAEFNRDGVTAQVVHGNYSEIKDICERLGIEKVNGILLDLGVSSYQLDTGERGFSYHTDAPLDMRMSKEGLSARDIINEYSEEQLAKILFEYGEEKFSRKIAANIVAEREKKPIETTLEFAEIIKNSIPAKFRREKNPCKKSFQAVRIAVNNEFGHLDRGLDDAFDMLDYGGRLCVITFHSLEDRIVKQRFASFCTGCICPPDFPQCVCGRKPRGKLVNRKPIEADEAELEANARSRSAKLRVIEKIEERK